jgi:hypothetical protein
MWFIAGGAVLLVVFAFTCGVKESKVGSFQWSRLKRYDSDKAKFRKIHGRIVRSLGFKDTKHLRVEYAVACVEGNLSLSIIEPNGNRTTLFSGDQVNDSGTEIIEVTPGSKYKLEIKGERAKGTYEVSWTPVTV